MAAEELHAAQVDAAGVGGLHGLVAQLVGPHAGRPAVPSERLGKADRVVVAPGIGGDERPPGREHFIVQVDRAAVGILRRLDVPDPALEIDMRRLRALELAGALAARRLHQKPRAGLAVAEFPGALLFGELRGDGGDDAVGHALRPPLWHRRSCDLVDDRALPWRRDQLEDLPHDVQSMDHRFGADAGQRPFSARALNRVAGERMWPLATEPRHPRFDV